MSLAREELLAAVPPIASLLRKSEKAICKLTPGTWQHSMLTENIAALKLALLLMENKMRDATPATMDEITVSIQSIDSMIQKTEKVLHKFLPGTSQYSASRNRLNALQTARDVLGRSVSI